MNLSYLRSASSPSPLWMFAETFYGYSLSVDASAGGTSVKGSRKRVLIIDDEVEIADSLAEILSDKGYDATAFYNGAAAINFARTHCPDLVISDVMMPKINGVETVLAIRRLCPVTRILLFSGQAGTRDILATARALGHEFELLPKPIHPDQLLKRLSSLSQA